MASDRRVPERLEEAWLDIPDPCLLTDGAAGRTSETPRTTSDTRRQVKRRRVWTLAACIAWVAVMLLFWGLADLENRMRYVSGQAMIWSGLLIGALTLSLEKGERGLGGPMRLTRIVAIGTPLVFMGVSLIWAPGGGPVQGGIVGPLDELFGCLGAGLVIVVPLVVVAIGSVRRSFPAGARWRGALLGAACGLAGAVVLALHCANPFGGHVAVGHGLPILLATLSGALLGEKLARA